MSSAFDGLTGKEIADIAYDQLPIKPDNLGRTIEILIYIFTILCGIVVGLRIWVRTYRESSKRRWNIDDWLALFGFVRMSHCNCLKTSSDRNLFSPHSSQRAPSASSQSNTASAQATPTSPTTKWTNSSASEGKSTSYSTGSSTTAPLPSPDTPSPSPFSTFA